MAITYVKDIPDFTKKVEDVTNINELELTVNQLSASILEVQGDITTLAGAMTTANAEIDDIWESNNVLGSKNVLPFPYVETTKTQNGITYTVNSDGSITVSGTATSGSGFNLTPLIKNNPFKNMILSGCPQGGSGTTFYIRDRITNDGVLVSQILDIGEGNTITSTDEAYAHQIMVSVNEGTVITEPITFRPMIRPAEYQDSTYAPYAMTNKDITNIVKCNQTTNGTYTLKATVSSSGVAYAWTADT